MVHQCADSVITGKRLAHKYLVRVVSNTLSIMVLAKNSAIESDVMSNWDVEEPNLLLYFIALFDQY